MTHGNHCKRISEVVISTFEEIFKRIGLFIGRYPALCIVLSIFVTIGFGFGFTLLKVENRRDKLWVPSKSDNHDYLAYVTEHYKDAFLENIIFENENILTPESLKAMLMVDEAIKAINVGKSWESICFRIGDSCFVSSILQLWGFNETIINGLSQEDILRKINEPNLKSPITSKEINVLSLLGGVDNDTYISSAKAALAYYRVFDNSEFDQSKGRHVDKDAEDWELEFIEIITDDYGDIDVYGLAYTSFDIESEKSTKTDAMFLVCGYGLLFVYVVMMLSKFTLIEHRVFLALSGIISVCLAVAVSIGLGAILGFIYTPVHLILPFLLLGIGVDDMFVIVQSWDNLSNDEKVKPVHQQCSAALKHAGVSITVTSVTDFSAFLIGATSILPALRSFCVYCGIGIIFLFFFSIMFFTPTFCIDRRRVNSKRNACCCCYRHGEDYKRSKCSQSNVFQRFFEEVYGPVLMRTAVKVVVLIITASLLGFGIWGFIELEQYFNFRWFLPSDSHSSSFLVTNALYYPHNGVTSAIYLNNVDLFNERSKIDALYDGGKENNFVDPSSFSSWYEDFGLWIQENKWNDPEYNNVTMWPNTEEIFLQWVNEFLMDPTGGIIYSFDVIIDNTTGEIITSRITFSHVILDGSDEEIEAMDSIQALADGFQFDGDGYAFAYGELYPPFESNKVIQEELYRNMGLACICVFVVMLLLLAHFLTCLLVFLSIFFTLIDLAGFIHHWGLTIDVVVTIQLILSIGIAVDYAAHIGHAFMTVTGTRNERARKAIAKIGPAVFNGGFSTFLAFVLLSLSESYIFRTFFKIFLLVVVFGLFHGLVLLPVLLSWFGPAPYASVSVADDTNDVPETNTNSSVVDNSNSDPETGQFNNHAFENDSPNGVPENFVNEL